LFAGWPLLALYRDCFPFPGAYHQEAAFGVSREARGRAPHSHLGKHFGESDRCYQQFTYGGEEEDNDASIPTPWTDADEAVLVVLRNVPIEMADTSYGRFLATQKRDAKRAYYQHMDAEEKEAFLLKLTEIDTDDAKDGQSPPSNPTPV
jgi:hypothetical protein